MDVSFKVKNYKTKAALFGTVYNRHKRNEISEDVLDWLIDEVGDLNDVYWKSDDGFGNSLLFYVKFSSVIQLNRVKYWIEKRGIDPYDTDHRNRTAFDYIQREVSGRIVPVEVLDYFSSLQFIKR